MTVLQISPKKLHNVRVVQYLLGILSGRVLSLQPFPPPVYDRLQYANMEGEGLGDLVICGDVR